MNTLRGQIWQQACFSYEPTGQRNLQFGEHNGLQHKEGSKDDVCGYPVHKRGSQERIITT